jgi:hypothetical protein
MANGAQHRRRVDGSCFPALVRLEQEPCGLPAALRMKLLHLAAADAEEGIAAFLLQSACAVSR